MKLTKYGAYVLIALGVLLFIYRFDIIIETFGGTEHIPHYQLLTPAVLCIIGIVTLRLNYIKKKAKNKKDEKVSD